MLETVTWQAGGRHLEWREETGDEVNTCSFHASRGQILKVTLLALELTNEDKEGIARGKNKTKWKENKNDQ